jgi:hypothetical protein
VITADTITDEQIRELRERSVRLYLGNGDHSQWDVINLCRVALTDNRSTPHTDARARCAEILNARSKESR